MEASDTTRDAEEFGTYLRSGGWRLGLLVARSVQPRSGQGQLLSNRKKVGKVSGHEFASHAGTSAARVLRYYDAWVKAAEDGIVPTPSDLQPGTEIELPDDEETPWTTYYSAGSSSTDASVKRSTKAIARVAEEDSEFASTVATAALGNATPEAKREAFVKLAGDPDVAGDDRTRLHAESKLDQAAAPSRARASIRRAEAEQKNARSLGLVNALLAMDHIVDLGGQVGKAWRDGSDGWDREEREEFRTRWNETLIELSMVSETVSNLDDELSKILGGD